MRRRITRLFLCVGLASATLAAQPTQPPPAAPTFLETLIAAEQADQARFGAINSLSLKSKFTGAIGIAAGRTTRSWLFDRARVGKDDRGYDARQWRWASVTKQIVAVLVLQEVAKGTVALDQPVARYLPQFSSANAGKITVRQLLRHQSGLPNPDDTANGAPGMAPFYLPGYKGNRDPRTGYCAGPVKGEPGGNWAYNNCDYIVAGALLEAVTGKHWAKLVEERIAKPLGLRSLRAFPAGGQTHTGLAGGKPEPKIDFAAFGAAGGLQGTLDELLVFDRALLAGTLLPPAQLAEMWNGQPDLGYIALGQWVFEARLKDCAQPVRLVERRGSIGGVQVRNFIAPDRGVAIVVFADQAEGDFEFGEIWQGSGFSHDLLNTALCKSGDLAK
jgi:CubicO group peptidase (beta-lactamase class C family)